jgi:RNA polymerase sigma-70 factor (ECF subfamily)
MSRLAKTSPVHIVWNPMWPLGQIRSVERFDASDADVIAASRIDAARFGEIFDRYFADIDRYLARRVGQAIADDLAAETFVIAFRARARYDPSAADARAWLFGIAANLARRHFRTERRRLRAYARTGVDPCGRLDTDEIDRRVDALSAAPALAGALAAIRHSDREILLLFAWAELSYEEIAVALSIPVGTVRSRLSRARARVRELLSPTGQVELERIIEGGPHG